MIAEFGRLPSDETARALHVPTRPQGTRPWGSPTVGNLAAYVGVAVGGGVGVGVTQSPVPPSQIP